MKRKARLQSAKKWLLAYTGENILRGYCKHFAVDWRCAAIELKQPDVVYPSDYQWRPKTCSETALSSPRIQAFPTSHEAHEQQLDQDDILKRIQQSLKEGKDPATALLKFTGRMNSIRHGEAFFTTELHPAALHASTCLGLSVPGDAMADETRLVLVPGHRRFVTSS